MSIRAGNKRSRVTTRDAVIDFSISMGDDVGTFLAPVTQTPATQFWVYTEIFPPAVWAVIVASVFAAGLTLFVVDATGANRFHGPRDVERFGVTNGVAVSALLVLQLSYGIAMVSLSSRLAFLFAAFMAYLVFTYYTCDLTARMTSGPAPSAISKCKIPWHVET